MFDFFLSNFNLLNLICCPIVIAKFQDLCWRDMERVDCLVLFLILVKSLWVSVHLIWFWLSACSILLLLCLDLFIVYLITRILLMEKHFYKPCIWQKPDLQIIETNQTRHHIMKQSTQKIGYKSRQSLLNRRTANVQKTHL